MINRSSQSCPKLIIQLAIHIYNRLLLSEYILCRVGSPTIVQRARLSAPILSHLLLGRQGLLVRNSDTHYNDDHYAYAAFL